MTLDIKDKLALIDERIRENGERILTSLAQAKNAMKFDVGQAGSHQQTAVDCANIVTGLTAYREFLLS
jgi:hypothetical protein